jgi:egghead protein (zeste-white 4 protein)
MRSMTTTRTHGQVLPAPHFACFLLVYLAFLAVAWWAWDKATVVSPTDLYASVVWTLPVLTSSLGLAGGLRTARRMRHMPSSESAPPAAQDMLVVVVPTIGRQDTHPALKRVVGSYCRNLPHYFPWFRIDLIIEDDCQTADEIAALAMTNPSVRVVTVPHDYRTPKRTRFKARANHYAEAVRYIEGEARDDVWVLHMDDDTGIGLDTARELARFVNSQQTPGTDAKHLAQGVLCFPREHTANRLVWLADAIRPGCDIGLFAATTGRGSPSAGLHGELLLVRASIEAAIGWDFGPRAIVEDAEFALQFCERYPGRSDWIPARSYGASPATVTDFVRQRERWVWGLLELTMRSAIPLRRRLLLLHNVVVWSCAPLAHPAVVLLIGLVLGDPNPNPASAILAPVWALNIAYCAWLYWEGMKLNVLSSAQPRRLWWEIVCLVALSVLFALWELAGILRGIVHFLRSGEPTFTVIAKPA